MFTVVVLIGKVNQIFVAVGVGAVTMVGYTVVLPITTMTVGVTVFVTVVEPGVVSNVHDYSIA
jgi:hypothetical protein